MMLWPLTMWQGPWSWDRAGSVPSLLASFIILEGTREAAGENYAPSPALLSRMLYYRNGHQNVPASVSPFPLVFCVCTTFETYHQPCRGQRETFERAGGFSSLPEMEGECQNPCHFLQGSGNNPEIGDGMTIS